MEKTSKNSLNLYHIAVCAVMSAISAILMMLELSVPFVPSFLKFDFSDLPAYLTSFALGPVYGAVVELIKNAIHLPFTATSGVGELANFLLGAALVVPAGVVYKKHHTRSGALAGTIIGAVVATVISFFVNYFITYPAYALAFGGMDNIIAAYHAIIGYIDTLPKALIIVNMPFTFIKGIINSIITFLIYHKLSPILKGRK